MLISLLPVLTPDHWSSSLSLVSVSAPLSSALMVFVVVRPLQSLQSAHIKNISPNYPRDVLQMFDKRNMTITPCSAQPCFSVARRASPVWGLVMPVLWATPATPVSPGAGVLTMVQALVPGHPKIQDPRPLFTIVSPLSPLHCLSCTDKLKYFPQQRIQPFTCHNMKNLLHLTLHYIVAVFAVIRRERKIFLSRYY